MVVETNLERLTKKNRITAKELFVGCCDSIAGETTLENLFGVVSEKTTSTRSSLVTEGSDGWSIRFTRGHEKGIDCSEAPNVEDGIIGIIRRSGHPIKTDVQKARKEIAERFSGRQKYEGLNALISYPIISAENQKVIGVYNLNNCMFTRKDFAVAAIISYLSEPLLRNTSSEEQLKGYMHRLGEFYGCLGINEQNPFYMLSSMIGRTAKIDVDAETNRLRKAIADAGQDFERLKNSLKGVAEDYKTKLVRQDVLNELRDKKWEGDFHRVIYGTEGCAGEGLAAFMNFMQEMGLIENKPCPEMYRRKNELPSWLRHEGD